MRGLLAPFLRDTLVAFNYAHYAPPGAQVLYTNPLFVRSHDFLGVQGANHTWQSTELFGTGWPSNGGGRLVGSLAGLPYALAEAEQNFLIPSQTQALIWGDLVPQMILSAKIPRWWNVTPAQMHWVGLHMRYARVAAGRSRAGSGAAQAGARRPGLAGCAGAHRDRRAPARSRATCKRRWKRSRRRKCSCWRRIWRRARRSASARSLAEIRQLAAGAPGAVSVRGDFARLRHAQADAGEFLSAGAAEPAHVPDADGILQPHHGGELGIEHAVLGGAGRRDACHARRS